MTRIARYLRFAVLGKSDHPRRPRRRRVGYRGPIRDRNHGKWIRSMPCAACGSAWRVEAAHTGTDGGIALKSSDSSRVPLCWGCHRGNPRSYHTIGRRAFEELWGLDFESLSAGLWATWQELRTGGRKG